MATGCKCLVFSRCCYRYSRADFWPSSRYIPSNSSLRDHQVGGFEIEASANRSQSAPTDLAASSQYVLAAGNRQGGHDAETAQASGVSFGVSKITGPRTLPVISTAARRQLVVRFCVVFQKYLNLLTPMDGNEQPGHKQDTAAAFGGHIQVCSSQPNGPAADGGGCMTKCKFDRSARR